MPMKPVDLVNPAPLIMPAFKGDFQQWIQDCVRELEIRLKEYGNAINQGALESDELRYAAFVGAGPRPSGDTTDADIRRLVALFTPMPQQQNDEAIRRHAMGV